jgi:hypothetical protein
MLQQTGESADISVKILIRVDVRNGQVDWRPSHDRPASQKADRSVNGRSQKVTIKKPQDVK